MPHDGRCLVRGFEFVGNDVQDILSPHVVKPGRRGAQLARADIAAIHRTQNALTDGKLEEIAQFRAGSARHEARILLGQARMQAVLAQLLQALDREKGPAPQVVLGEGVCALIPHKAAEDVVVIECRQPVYRVHVAQHQALRGLLKQLPGICRQEVQIGIAAGHQRGVIGRLEKCPDINGRAQGDVDIRVARQHRAFDGQLFNRTGTQVLHGAFSKVEKDIGLGPQREVRDVHRHNNRAFSQCLVHRRQIEALERLGQTGLPGPFGQAGQLAAVEFGTQGQHSRTPVRRPPFPP